VEPSEPVLEEPETTEAPPVEEEPVEEEPVIEEPEVIDNLSTEEIVEIINDVNPTSLSVNEINTVFSEDVLEELDDQQIEQLIEAIEPDDLTDEQAEAIAVALSEAPENVKEEFESQINIFGGQFDSYVAIGSKITVGERRVIVAVAAVTMIAPAPAMASRRKS
jgi:hypothetical protein